MKKNLTTVPVIIISLFLLSACTEKNSVEKQDNKKPVSANLTKNVKANPEPVEEVAEEGPEEAADPAPIVEAAKSKEQTDTVKDSDEESVKSTNSVDEESMETFIAEDGEVAVKSIVIANGLSEREPVDPGTSFVIGASEKIFAYLDVKNETEQEAVIYVSWKRPDRDKEFGKTELTVKPAKSWHTWSFTRNAKWEGRWEAIVTNSQEEIIARAPFIMTKE
ncbi:MAG: DUF2914 domain-containing protein [Deltaproteobacteria bacterium]|nr:DUF2914 domain-containing protein [Deltaproteobacteria bacterium]